MRGCNVMLKLATVRNPMKAPADPKDPNKIIIKPRPESDQETHVK